MGFRKKDNFLDEYYLDMGYKNEKRRIRVLLPVSYGKNKSKKYPVVYFHDGQNIFFDQESYSGISWGLIDAREKVNEFIGVAIDNSPERMGEYSPWDFEDDQSGTKLSKGCGKAYGDFVINRVKPFIDKTYRTKKSKKFTSLVGSSAGGNISAYLGKIYQNKIGNLGIFSLASFIFKDDFEKFFQGSKLKANQKVYIKVGTDESEDRVISQAYIDSAIAYQNLLLKAGLPLENIKLKIIKADNHSEKDWAKYLVDCLDFLL